MNKKEEISNVLEELGAKPSISEEGGLTMLDEDDLSVFCPGVSSGGFAEIRMAMQNFDRRVVATTIDESGIDQVKRNLSTLGLENRVDVRLEDLREKLPYEDDVFDFVYARLVLHYLSSQDLDNVLREFHRVTKEEGRLFIVVRSVENVNYDDESIEYDEKSKLTTEIYRDDRGRAIGKGKRYFHTPESIIKHIERAGFEVVGVGEYEEQLYRDFMRREKASKVDYLVEVTAKNRSSS